MSAPGTKAKSIPSWQQVSAGQQDTSSKDPPSNPTPVTHPDARALLIQKASKFLDDAEIQEASRERKITFLESKGLTKDEIARLLGIVDDQTSIDTSTDDEKRPEQLSPIDSADKTPHSLQTDQRPIITYPEFLLQSQKPPPIITARRLLTTFYLVSGLAATLYGTSKYVVEPMVESLSSARHSLFEGTSANLESLNEKLESAVSTIPDGAMEDQDSDDADAESISSDPARHFSRTKATQTTPHLSRSSSDASVSPETPPLAPISQHAEHLSDLHKSLSDLKQTHCDLSYPIGDSVHDLQKFLGRLPLEVFLDQGSKIGGRSSGEDGISKVKAELRGIKGVLLSARSFPTGPLGR